MDSFKERLQRLKEQRKRVSNHNFKEVLEENELAKRPANWEKKLENSKKRIAEEEERQKAEEAGQNYDLKKSLDIQADEFDKWDRIRSGKQKRADTDGADHETSAKIKYSKFAKQIKPDLEEYKSVKDKVGEDIFYAQGTSDVPKSALTVDSQEGIDRMVEDVNKQIEIQSKRSRRRRFDEDADVDYINERNMRFNKKLEKFYGNHSEEIKQNFERGTAL